MATSSKLGWTHNHQPNNRSVGSVMVSDCCLCNQAAIANARANVTRDLEERGFSDLTVFAVELAVGEALTNAFKHGHHCSTDKRIHMAYAIDDGCITVVVTDEGLGFDPTTVPDPTNPNRLTQPWGRGIFLMRHYMDEVVYSNDGRTVTMTKRNSP
jgi:serine/threonine-protein kinase RsbW